MRKVAIIGVGNLGSCIAYEIANRGITKEIVLIDIVKKLAEGNAEDIAQAIAFRNNTEVYAGDYGDAEDSQIIIVAAGKPRSPEMKTRLELLEANKSIVREVALNIEKIGGEPIIVTLTNPVDIMNYLIWKYSGFPREKVIGSAGMLDSARFRRALSRKFSTQILNIEAYVIGEHGENQVPVFSRVKIAGKNVTFSEEEKAEIHEELRKTALEVISKKGATIYAPANNTVNMIEGILTDRSSLYICSVVLNGEYGLKDLSIGVPAIIGKNGVKKILEWDLSEDEKKTFYLGAESIRKALKNILE